MSTNRKRLSEKAPLVLYYSKYYFNQNIPVIIFWPIMALTVNDVNDCLDSCPSLDKTRTFGKFLI